MEVPPIVVLNALLMLTACWIKVALIKSVKIHVQEHVASKLGVMSSITILYAVVKAVLPEILSFVVLSKKKVRYNSM